MREFVVILFVILILLGLTAYKYRRQIAMVIGFGKMLRDARANIKQSAAPRQIDPEPSDSTPKRSIVRRIVSGAR